MEETKTETPDQTQNTVGSEAPKRDTLPSMMEGLSGSYEGRSYQELADAVRILSSANVQQARTVDRFRRDRERQGYVIKQQNADIAALRSANKEFSKKSKEIAAEANKMNEESIGHLEMISELAHSAAEVRSQLKIAAEVHEYPLPSRLNVSYRLGAPTLHFHPESQYKEHIRPARFDFPDFIVFGDTNDLDVPTFLRNLMTPTDHERVKKP